MYDQAKSRGYHIVENFGGGKLWRINVEFAKVLPSKILIRHVHGIDYFKMDGQVQEYVIHVRKRGLVINTSVVIAAGRGMVMNRDANQLSDNGGGIKLTDEWAKNLLKRMGFVKCKACSKAKVNPEQFEKLKEEFLLEIKNIVTMDEIPHELILNFDQTALNYVSVTS